MTSQRAHEREEQTDRMCPPHIDAIDPATRLVACLLFALAEVTLSAPLWLVAGLALSAMMALLARLPPWSTLRRMAAMDGFMIAVVGLLPFTVPGAPVWQIGNWPISQEGSLQAAQILLKSNAVVLMILALLGSMEPTRLGQAMSRLGVSDKFVHLFLFTLRYIDVLRWEYRRLRLSMKARGFQMRWSRHTWRSIGYLFGMMLVRSLDRSDRIAAAMRCRGFSGRFHPLSDTAPITHRDRAFAGMSAATCLALAVLGHL